MNPKKRNILIGICCGIILIGILVRMRIGSKSSKIKNKSIECEAVAKNLQQSIKPGAQPCDDFYEYACGNWPKFHNLSVIPKSSLILRMQENYDKIFKFLNKNNTDDEPEAVHKVRKLFNICKNETAFTGSKRVYEIMSQAGVPLEIMGTKVNVDFDYVAAIARINKMTWVKLFFEMEVQPNVYNRSINSIWLKKPSTPNDPYAVSLSGRVDEPKTTSCSFVDALQSKICNDSEPSVCSTWNDVSVAGAYFTYVESINIIRKAIWKFNQTTYFVKFTLEELQNFTDNIASQVNSTMPKFNWTKYTEVIFDDLDNVTLDLSDPSKVDIYVEGLSFLENMLKFIFSKDAGKIRLALWWGVIYNLLPFTDSLLFDQMASLVGASREEKCGGIMVSHFGLATNYAHFEKGKYAEIKAEITEVFENVKHSFENNMKKVSWMDEKTKEKALKKLASMRTLLAYPEIIESPQKMDKLFENMIVKDDLFGTLLEWHRKLNYKKFSKLHKINDLEKFDEAIWMLPSNLVDAFYLHQSNAILVPFGILGDPFFNRGLKAWDYGSIGHIIGHELIHSFDNLGKEFDEMGNVKLWWEANTARVFEEKCDCFLKAYEKYYSNFSGIYVKTSSKLTINEDIADNGGFQQALSAYREYVSRNGEELRIKGFENFTHEQIFTLGFANFWCELPTETHPALVSMMDHSPAAVRVNGVLKNSKEFAEIWNCPRDSEMNPVEKCSIW